MKTFFRYLPAIAVPLGLATCSTTFTPGKSPVELPVSWKNAANFPTASTTRDLSRWWRRFDDPVLSRVISYGLANSPDTVSAAARIREARARRSETAAALLPSLFGSAGSNTQVSKTDGFSRVSGTTYSTGLDASWEIDWFGKNRSNLDAATADAGAAEENFHSVQAALASDIATAYTSLRADETRLSVFRRIVGSREETSQIATWRNEAGQTDSLESSQARSSLEQARATIPALQQSIEQRKNLLARLCGGTPGSLDAILNNGNPRIPSPPESLAIGIPADTIRQRPDVRQEGYQLTAAIARTRAADAERFPSLNLSGSLSASSNSASKIFDPRSIGLGLISGISGPIFDAGRIRANIAAQSAFTDQALQTYRSSILIGLSDTEDALIACRRSGERIGTLERATTAAREAATLADQRYEAGVIDLLTVLDAQRTLLSLEDSLISARADRTTAYIQLYKALGGGWSR